jgi:orotidine-5'-phosphate decarboxylase
MSTPSSANRIIVALDSQDLAQAKDWVASLSGAVVAFKLGLEFLSAHGPQGIREVQAAGAGRIFADTKFNDIPNTVAGAVRSICGIDPWLLNVHATAGSAAMRAARKAAEEYSEQTGKARSLIIAVTVLTSLDQAALAEIGVTGSVEEQVVRLANMAQASGMDGVVASPLEIRAIREACGPDFLIVTPGVRPAGGASHDQARIATPEAAIAAGADYLVIGRAITGAANPRAAAEAIAASLV